MKACRVCGIHKEIEEFQRKSSMLDGRATVCRRCDGARRIERKIEQGKRRPDPTDGHKWCNKCKTEKPLDDFYSRVSGPQKGKPHSHCIPCVKADNITRARARGVQPKKTPVDNAVRRAYLRREYSMTLERYQEICSSQGNCCPICKVNLDTVLPAIDHDHKCCAGSPSCGKCVRGVLCTRCNLLLGRAEERRDIFIGAISYLDGSA